ncbi:SP-RING-type domain-containing protein [Entamoeba marina]
MWFAVRDDPFPGDDEDIIIEDKVSFNCPLTRKLFEDPVKSTVCGHTFSKQAIISYIGSNRKRKCPVAGCDRSFGKNDLEKDVETIHAMERHQTAMSEDSSDSDSGEFV